MPSCSGLESAAATESAAQLPLVKLTLPMRPRGPDFRHDERSQSGALAAAGQHAAYPGQGAFMGATYSRPSRWRCARRTAHSRVRTKLGDGGGPCLRGLWRVRRAQIADDHIETMNARVSMTRLASVGALESSRARRQFLFILATGGTAACAMDKDRVAQASWKQAVDRDARGAAWWLASTVKNEQIRSNVVVTHRSICAS